MSTSKCLDCNELWKLQQAKGRPTTASPDAGRGPRVDSPALARNFFRVGHLARARAGDAER